MTGFGSLIAAAGAAMLHPFAAAYARLVRFSGETPLQRFERRLLESKLSHVDYCLLVAALWRFERGGPNKRFELAMLSALGAIERGAIEDAITPFGAAVLRDARAARLI